MCCIALGMMQVVFFPACVRRLWNIVCLCAHSPLLLLRTVFAGRWLMSFWTGTAKIHELYTAACGLYVCWLSIRAVTVLLAWMPQGRRVILLKVQEWTLMVQNITSQTYTLVCTPDRNMSARRHVNVLFRSDVVN